MTKPQYRPDVDGLRALAILSVIIFHAFPDVIKGGFVGVDIFFVISGFLISSILFSDLEKGSFSFIDFYSRRVKRIFPALILVLLSCLVFGGFILLADEYKQLGGHVAGGAGFVSNFILWKEVGYFDNAADTKPLLHLWSLGIEEQFYIVWPLLLFLVWKKRVNFLLLVSIIAAASFLVNLASVGAHPEAAFFSPLSRFWELMIGSILAYLSLHPYRHIPAGDGSVIPQEKGLPGLHLPLDRTSRANVSATLGLLLILFTVFRLNENAPFPGWWALAPTMGAFLLLQAGLDAWINRKLLANRAMIWVGLISYPLYLWHWPLLSFARIIEGQMPSAPIRFSAVILSVILAWATYRLVETPVRFRMRGRRVTGVLIVLMACLGFMGYKIYKSDGLKYRLSNFQQNADPFLSPKTKLEEARKLCRKSFPDAKGVCFSSPAKDSGTGKSIFFIGDSHSEALSTGFIDKNPDIPANSFGTWGCLPFIGVERFVNRGPKGCPTSLMHDLSHLSKKTNEVVVITARYTTYVTGTGFENTSSLHEPNSVHIQPSGQPLQKKGVNYAEVYAQGLRSTLNFLQAQNKQVVFVHQVPELGFDPKICVDRPFRTNIENACRLPRVEVEKRQGSYRDATAKVLAEFPGVRVFDPMAFLCDKTYCYARKDKTILYRDDDHVSLAGARLLSTGLRELILAE